MGRTACSTPLAYLPVNAACCNHLRPLQVTEALELGRGTLAKIKQNLAWAGERVELLVHSAQGL